MAFIRIKTIKGHKYAYLVENHWTGTSSRQKVSEYLGKVFDLPAKQSAPAPDMSGDFKSCADELIAWHLAQRGFRRKDQQLVKGKLAFDLNKQTFFDDGDEATCVIKANDGYLCKKTVADLKSYVATGTDQEAGLDLAKSVVNCGLDLPKELFVALFEKATATRSRSRKLAEELGKK
ncbi:MAG: hypothetical protein AABX47_10235 [Nanoarchaeota archaeon]